MSINLNSINSSNPDTINDKNSSVYSRIVDENEDFKNTLKLNVNKLEYENFSENIHIKSKEHFQKALKAIENLSDFDTGEKIDFNSLEEPVQKDLLQYLGKALKFKEELAHEKLDFYKVEIQNIDGKLFARNTYKNLQGQVIDYDQEEYKTGSKKHYKLEVGSPPLGDEDAHKSDEELKREYYEGKTDNFYGFQRKQAYKEGNKELIQAYENEDKKVLSIGLKDYLLLIYEEAQKSKERNAFLYSNKIQEYKIYKQNYNNLVDIFLKNSKNLESQNTQIAENYKNKINEKELKSSQAYETKAILNQTNNNDFLQKILKNL